MIPDVVSRSLATELSALVGAEHVHSPAPAWALRDATEARGLTGSAEAFVRPGDPGEVAAVLGWCDEHGVPLTPRGGGTGYAGGAVPGGGVVLGLERLRRVRSLDPLARRMEVEAGLTTAHVQRLARESGLLFPPDPGAAESSQIGGNVATNAGGPHALGYGVTRRWITGLEVAVAPGELIQLGGPVRKDVAGYDLVGLLAGSEGTLGVITSVWVSLVPHPPAALPVLGAYATAGAGVAAIERVLAGGVRTVALEYLDAGAVDAARGGFPTDLPASTAFLVLAETDGEEDEVSTARDGLLELLGEGALAASAPEPGSLWRWRAGVSHAVTAQRGGKVSEDVAVPLEHLGEAISETLAIGDRHGLEACSWGHAGDANLHSTFIVDPADPAQLERASKAAAELFEMALRLGGTISGEHGVGLVKRSHLARQLGPSSLGLHRRIKRAWDPKGTLNPGKKLPS